MSGWEKALADHKVFASSFDPLFWKVYLAEHPEVLHHILQDLYQVAGIDKGRPPDLDDLWELVAPKFSNKPFPEAFLDVLGARSNRQVAVAIGIGHSQFQRLVQGQTPIVRVHNPAESMRRLEAIAKALGIAPAYFSEWRRLWIMSVVDSALESKPNISVSIYRKFSGQEARSLKTRGR